jgi:hypothetical protein
MLRRPQIWVPLTIAIAGSLAFALIFTWGKDFGAFFILLLFGVPIFVAICAGILAWCIWAYLTKRREQSSLAGLILAALLWAPFFGAFLSTQFGDYAKFEMWSATHPQELQQFTSKDGNVLLWDSWGMAGMDNNSYLVSDHANSLADANAATRWAHDHHYSCDVAKVERMRNGIYLLTAFTNCPLG